MIFLSGWPIFRRRGDRWPREILHISYFRLHAVQIRCYAIALAHMFDATQLHLHTCSMLRKCTCAHVRCYAIALAHMLDATQLYVHTCSMLRHCTCTHARCYAVVLAHMLDATQFFLSTHAWCYAIVLKHTCSMYLISFLPVSWIKSKENSNTRLLTNVYSYMWRYHLPADVNF